MKTNSQISIWIASIVLIARISFLFIEQNNNTPQIEDKQNITSTAKIKQETPQETTKKINQENLEIKKQKELEELKKQQAIQEILEQAELEERLEKEAQKIAEKQLTENVSPSILEGDKGVVIPTIIPKKYDIQNMAFFSQAPYGNRNQPYQDACEEASLLIWRYYLKNLNKTKAEYNTDLLAMVALEMEMLWYFESTTIMEMKQIINRRDPTLHARIIEHPTIRDIEKEISQDNVVVAPFYGKWLKNPHYALWWPEYHFLVIKGYDQTNFITHDVWTLRWANREYTKTIIMENIHDRNRTDVRMWAPRILILEK